MLIFKGLESRKKNVSYSFENLPLDSFIMEEYEKAERTVPQWKIDWVKKIIKNKSIIVKNDTDFLT